MSRLLASLGARLVRSTHIIDRAYQRFDRMRSLLVLSIAPESFHREYSRLAYDATSLYRAGAKDFRQGLFAWEARAIDQFFPDPPARVLIGGAGGGREAFALIDRGYSVVAFDPASRLAQSMAAASRARPGVLEAYCGGYEDLPILANVNRSGGSDLRLRAPFDAAILGWSSIAHLVNDEARLQALRQMGQLTHGPILVSFFLQADTAAPEGRRWLRPLNRRAASRGKAVFTVAMGYTRLLTEVEFRQLAERAGLALLAFDHDSTWPNAVLRSNSDRKVDADRAEQAGELAGPVSAGGGQ